ncbi:MAG: hypothetical protein CML66_28115 [Rhodobacteraceae bacterium]|nr:hypothetical protein [Paracoccaceae bacterium]MAY47695.1 hypothetical protein [Paracoccaceae bacterium]
MPMVLSERGPVFFAHVPKTGGTSVEHYLYQRFGPLSLNDVNKQANLPGTGLICAVNHLSALDLREMIPAQAILVFAMVRDPLERCLSEYAWQQGASRMSRMPFSTWLRVMARCVAIDARAYGNHIRPQDDLVPEQARIFRLEDGFDQMIDRIDTVTASQRPDLAVGHLKPRAGHGPQIRVHREDVALIQSLYARDYARFGYAPRTLSDYPRDRRAPARAALATLLAPAVMARQRRDWIRPCS